jgi:ferric-dicitrate binding protein FerR (iron transport regulator)
MIDRKIISMTALSLAFLLFALSSLISAAQVWAQTVAGSISAISGSATITRGGATLPAANGTKVNVGDRLVTAASSNLTITLSDGSQIELSDSSTLTVDENTLDANGTRASTKLSLLNGLVKSLVRTTPGTPPNYEIHTPNAVAAARGTNYDVDRQSGVRDDKYPGCYEFSHVSVYEGTVEVYNPTNPGSPKVEVTKSQKVTIPCSGAVVVGAAVATGIASLGAPGIGAGAIAGAAVAGSAAVGGTIVGTTGVFSGGGGGPAPKPVSPSE